MSSKRPTSVTVIAILHFIFGGLGICLALFQLSGAADSLSQSVTPGRGQQQVSAEALENYVQRKNPNYKFYQVGQTGFDLALSLLMIVSGVGVLRVQAWGRN